MEVAGSRVIDLPAIKSGKSRLGPRTCEELASVRRDRDRDQLGIAERSSDTSQENLLLLDPSCQLLPSRHHAQYPFLTHASPALYVSSHDTQLKICR